jgi:hypothetical protein
VTGGKEPFAFEKDLAKIDFAGLHTQHAYAWNSFNTALQILLVIEALPWIAAGSLLHQQQDFTALLGSRLFAFVLIFSGLMGLVGYQVIVYNRLLILFYARALNEYRGLFADAVPVGRFLPTRADQLPYRDRHGVMVLLTGVLGVINSIYLAFAGFTLMNRYNLAAAVTLGASLLICVLIFVIVWYFHVTSDAKVPGFRAGAPPSG